MMLHTILFEKAALHPEKPAIIHGDRRVGYGELAQMTERIAAYLLQQGLRRGDRVAIFMENSAYYAASLLGIQKAGGISVDINPQYSAHEAGRIAAGCSPVMLVAEGRLMPVVAGFLPAAASIRTVIVTGEAVDRDREFGRSGPDQVAFDEVMAVQGGRDYPEASPHDVAAIVYTSGTTGAPKGVMLTHANFMANAASIVEYLRLTEQDTAMVILPFCYSYGKSLLTTHLMAGGTLVLENSFMYPNAVFERMIGEEVTGFAGVPSTYAIMLNRSNIRNYRFPKLRYITQAGGHMPPAHVQEIAAILPGVSLFVMYGQTEATSRLTYVDPADLPRKPGSIGKPIPGVAIDLITAGGVPAAEGEEGEIVATGQNVMAGYWQNPEETAKVLRSGRLHTGDMAIRDSEGYLYIVGRRSDMIKSGAHRISPKEIEDVIHEMPEVHEVCVIGVPDPILGEALEACVVLKGGGALGQKDVQRYCKDRLAVFKIPRRVTFVGALPKTASGKIQRHRLRAERDRGEHTGGQGTLHAAQ